MTTHATTWWGVLSSAVSALSIGYAVVPNTSGRFVVATAANRASFGRAWGVAITAASDQNPSFEYQVASVLSADDSDIGTGTAGDWVIVAADGSLERKATPTAGDDVIGRCPHTTGDVQIMPGVWDSENTSPGGGDGGLPGTILELFGDDLAHFWGDDYNDTTGGWPDAAGTANADNGSDTIPNEGTVNGHTYPIFNGVGAALSAGDLTTLDGVSSYCLFGAIKSDPTNPYGGMLVRQLSFYVEIDASGGGIVATGYTAGTLESESVSDGEWHRWIFNVEGNVGSLWVDGVLVGSDTFSAITDVGNPFHLGKNGSNFLNGSQTAVGIVTRTATPGETAWLDRLLAEWVGGASASAAGGSTSIAGACTLEQFGAVGDDVADDSGALNDALAALAAGTYRALIFGAKKYFVPTSGHVPYGCTIKGQGAATVLRTNIDDPVLYTSDADAGDRDKSTTIEDFDILGNSTGTDQTGIEIGRLGGDGSTNVVVNNVTVRNVGGRCFSWAYEEHVGNGPRFNVCKAIGSNDGFAGFGQGICNGCEVYDCTRGLVIGNGNVTWDGDITGCDVGIDVLVSGNDGHSIIRGHVNHNTINVRWAAIANGMTFDGTHLYEGDIVGGANTGMVQFDNAQLDPRKFLFSSSKARFVGSRFDDDYWDGTFTEAGNCEIEFLDCAHLDGSIPSYIGSRVHATFDFASDADASLSTQQSVAQVIEITDSGTALTTARGVTSTRAPDRGVRGDVANRTAQSINFFLASGDGLVVPTNKTLTYGADGVDAVCIRISDNNASSVAPGSFDETEDATELLEPGDFDDGTDIWTAAVGFNARSVVGTPPPDVAGDPDFQNAHQLEIGTGTETASDLFTVDLTGFAAVTPDTADINAGQPYAGDNIWSLRASGNAGLCIQNDGGGTYEARFWVYDGTSVKEALATIGASLGSKIVIHYRYHWDGGVSSYVQIGINGTWGATVPLTTPIDASYSADRVDLGRNYSATAFYDGRLHALGFYNAIKNDGFVNGLIALYG